MLELLKLSASRVKLIIKLISEKHKNKVLTELVGVRSRTILRLENEIRMLKLSLTVKDIPTDRLIEERETNDDL